jgi:hypothetical protein
MQLDDKILDNLTTQAKTNPRLRIAMDLRNTPKDYSQRMLNAQEPGTVMPTPASWEFGSRSDSAGKDKMDIL